MTWQYIRIGEIGRVVTGDTPPKSQPDYYGPAFPFIKPTDMKVGQRYTLICDEGYSDVAYEKYEKKLIPEGATAVVTIGSIGQKLTLTHTPCFVNQAVNAVIPDSEKFDKKFVFYLLKHNLKLVKQADTGASSGRENVSKSNFTSLQIYATLDKQEQVRIAHVLDSFDSAIENNQRRIELLEESARLLYRELFVSLRLHGQELALDAEELPEGWRRLQLADICCQVKEQADPTKVDSDTPYLSMEHMESKSISLGEWETAGKVNSSKLRFQRRDVLFGRIRPYFHKVGIAQVDGITSTDMIVARPNSEELLPLVALTMSSDEFVAHAVATSNGTKMPRADWKVLKEWSVLLPGSSELTEFSEKVLPVLDLLESLSSQNRLLRSAREALLPKLMSGELSS